MITIASNSKPNKANLKEYHSLKKRYLSELKYKNHPCLKDIRPSLISRKSNATSKKSE